MPHGVQLSLNSGTGLADALVASSRSPLLLLDEQLRIVSASRSFCRAFGFELEPITGTTLAGLGAGEWKSPQLRALLIATFAGTTDIDGYEMDLLRDGHDCAHLIMNAHKLGHDAPAPLIALTITDVTQERRAIVVKDELIRQKEVLMKELQHRVANSLQILASVLMVSARRVQSEETRLHLQNAHHRIISIATLQQQLAASSADSVELRPYFSGLCESISASMIDEEGELTLRSTADESVVTPTEATSLGLIVTELVINALKHAFPDRKQPGEISVAYASEGTGFALSVSDHGVGIAASDRPTEPGLGTGIVDALARNLGATVETTDNAPGTNVTVLRLR